MGCSQCSVSDGGCGICALAWALLLSRSAFTPAPMQKLECCQKGMTDVTEFVCFLQEVQPWDQGEGAEVALSES